MFFTIGLVIGIIAGWYFNDKVEALVDLVKFWEWKK